MRIGISVITHAGQNIWENGMGQNVLFLARLLQRIEFVESVTLVDVGDQQTMPPQVDLAAMGLSLVTGFLGLFLAMPIVGHATWHLYRRAVEPQLQAVA